MLFVLALPLEIALIIEVAKQSNEAQTVSKHDHVHGVRKITLCEKVVPCMCGQQHKLELKKQNKNAG